MFKFWFIFTFLIAIEACLHDLCLCAGDTCTACLASFTYLNNNTCYPCPIQCAMCSSAAACLSCRPSYYLSNQLCTLCPLNCQTCNPACTQCINGYALHQSKCVPCNDANALTCQTLTTVSACMPGYWKNGNSCSPCRQFCLFCSSPSNCFQCQQGYQVSVSFGSYCSSCSSGCRICSSLGCTQCFYSYQLVNGVCIDISKNCSQIKNCKECSFANSTVSCHSCYYPYYLNNSVCTKGSSILCQNGSIGPMFYQCIDFCHSFGYQIDTYGSGIVCEPLSWVDSNYQLYFSPHSQLFQDARFYSSAQTIAFRSNNIDNSFLSFRIIVNPYYKLQIYFKMIAINLTTQSITINYNLRDNRSNYQSHQYIQPVISNYHYFYHNFTTKSIQDQTINFNLSAATLTVPHFVIGLSELIIQVYSCPDNCRLCYNKELCLQCFGNYFNTPENQCTSSCSGYIQLYLPEGNINNYTSKSCVLKCPSSFYTSQNLSTYSCIKCSGNCITCLSDFQCLTCISPLIYYEINYTCLSSCPNTHFSNNRICEPCNAPCETCLDYIACLTCSVGYLTSNKCQSTCPVGTYQNNLNNTCSPCDFKCTSCIGNPTYCLSCTNSYLLSQSSCVQNCTFGLYYRSDQTCKPCLIPCLMCTAQAVCLSCSIGYLFGTQCLSQCPSQYYADSFNALCKPCSNGCLTCLSSTICLSCPNSTNLFSYACYQVCPINTYSSWGICVNCLLPCENCINQSFCLSCSIGYLSKATLGLCVNQCENGYYGFDLNRSCLPCTSNCSSCSAASYICISCSNQFLLQGSSCVPNCTDGLFNLSGICYSCSYPCLTCANYNYFCTSCYNSYILINNTCQTECPLSTYLHISQCLSCQPPCSTCLSASECITCTISSLNQTFLYGTQCSVTCPPTTFADPSSLICRNCLYPCQQCYSEQVCLSCLIGYLDKQNGICSGCPNTMFANETSKQCQKCSLTLANCQICLSSTECLQCSENFYLYNSTCIGLHTCLNFTYYYADKLMLACSRCVSPCISCLNETFCLSCQYGYLMKGYCLITCPSNFYQLSNLCVACSPPCLTCSTSSICLSCNLSSLQRVLMIANSSCIQQSECPFGYFIQNTLNILECLKCLNPCSTCLNSTFCMSCSTGILLNGSCKSLCPNMYYAETSNSNLTFCSQCSSSCSKCRRAADYCTSCNGGLYLRNHSCVHSCGNRYYLDQTVLECFQCLQPCGNCSSASTCSDCLNLTYILYYGECLTSCPEGTYSNQGNCSLCPSSCLTCSYSSLKNMPLCINCNFGLYMSSQIEGQCISKCNVVEYGDILTRTCFRCIFPCLSCSDSVHCLSCQTGYLLYKRQCLKISTCPVSSYLLNQTCVADCGILWANPATSACISQCTPIYLKIASNNLKECLNQCPNNYRVDSNYSCLSCNDGQCKNLLTLQIESKNIFNVLFLKLTFSQAISGKLLQKDKITITLGSNSRGRLLNPKNISFQISSTNLDAIWIQLSINESLKNQIISLSFVDFYIFQKPLQILNYNITIKSFDYYTSDQSAAANSFQNFAKTMSIMLVIFFIANLFLNAGHLSYSIIDYYQLLFMVLFLSIDFSPQLNHFLYGFRYSHFMFLPQIFKINSEISYTTSTPDQFGIIVPDVNFINNTGQDFIIIFVTIGILAFCKLIEICCQSCGFLKSNRVHESSDPEQQQQEEKGILRFVKAVVSRFKWNYFNDAIYSIYFSIMLFAFSQLYDLQSRSSAVNLISILLAFLFIFLGIFFPFFLGWFLRKNEKNLIEHSLQKQKHDLMTSKKIQQSTKQKQMHQDEKQQVEQSIKSGEQKKQELSKQQGSKNGSSTQIGGSKFEILTDYKCFVSGIKLKVRLGFYQIPIRYSKKLILAILLVYLSQYPSLVLGIIMMFCFINILITLVLKPYRLTFEQVLYPIFDSLYLIIFLIICLIQLPLLDFTKESKLTASYVTIALCALLSLMLAIHNIVINVVEIIKYFCKVDYFSKYYQTEYVETSDQSDHQTQQGSNNPLRVQALSQEAPIGSEIFSGLDIYLKRQATAPQYLIKCVKQEEPIEERQVYKERQQNSQIKDSANSLESSGFTVRNDQQEYPNLVRLSANKGGKRQSIQKLVKGIQPIDLQEEDSEY